MSTYGNSGSHDTINSEHKRCGECGQNKPRTEFNKKGNGLQAKCRACGKAYSKRYYANNSRTLKPKLAERRDKEQAARQEQIRQVRDQTVCSRCNGSGDLLDVNGSVSKLVKQQRPFDEIAAALDVAVWVCRSCHGKQAGAARAGKSRIQGAKTVAELILDAARATERGVRELHSAVAAERPTTIETVRQQVSKLTTEGKLVRVERGKYRTVEPAA